VQKLNNVVTVEELMKSFATVITAEPSLCLKLGKGQ
jgi:hypothetical protein